MQVSLAAIVLSLNNMHKNKTAILFLSVLIFVSTALPATADTLNILFTREKFVIRSLKAIHGAQVTYASVYGNGHYAATLEALRDAD